MKFGLAIILFAATFGVQPLPQEDGPLEPSVQNEVDHAVSLGERWLAVATRDFSKVFNDSKVPKDSCASGEEESQVAWRTNSLACTLKASTNGLTREKIALRLISSQRGAGWWTTSTNMAPTKMALEILKGL